jgi:predicted DNA binding CopG/RHH family protein
MRERIRLQQGSSEPVREAITRQVTIRLDPSTIDYFKGLSAESGIPYQTLISLYLRDCAATRRSLSMD